MKTTTSTIALLLLVSMSIAQNYAPFSATTSKRFFDAGNTLDNDFFFHSTNSSTSVDTTIFDQYYALRNNGNFEDLPECMFWGGSVGIELDTTWLGNQLRWNPNTQELLLANEFNEQLLFNFGLSIGNSSVFYSNSSFEYQIEHTLTSLQTFYGVTDSIQHFQIQVFDNIGNPVSSSLNGVEIKLSKNYGLISFIQCYRFPAVEQVFELEGQTNPTIGHYQLTYDECYPWIAGDVVQYVTNNVFPGSSPVNKIAYQTLTVVDRIETADSVKLYLTSALQEVNPAMTITPFSMPSAPVLFKKGTVVSEKPSNMNQLHPQLSRAWDGPTLWCDSLSSFSSSEEFSHYCDSCRCYGGYDGFSQDVMHEKFVASLGKFRLSYQDYGFPLYGGHRTGQLVYSNINGVECGSLWGVQDKLILFELSIAPNPTKDIVKIESDQPIDAIRVLDLSGRVIIHSPDIASHFTEISIASFEKGAYILEVTANGSTQTRTIIRE